jgi:hypothetical protein
VFRLIAIVLALASLAGCSAPPTRDRRADELPPLRLAPAALGRELALQQRLEFRFDGRRDSIEAMLEVDAREVRLLLHAAGQSALRLTFDGTNLVQSRAEWLPAALTGERVLDDLQLVFWPLTALRAVLPPGWRIEQTDGVRRLRHGSSEVLRVEYPDVRTARLVHNLRGYRLDVQSIEADP